jgi:Polysaccharide lyase
MRPLVSNLPAVIAVLLCAAATATTTEAVAPAEAARPETARVDLLGNLHPPSGSYLVPGRHRRAYEQTASPAGHTEALAVANLDCENESSVLHARLEPIAVRDNRPFAVDRGSAEQPPVGPALAWMAPAAGSAVYGPSVRLAVGASLPDRIEAIDFYVGVSLVASQQAGAGLRVAYFDSTAFADGSHQLTARARLSGGGATTTSLPIEIDNSGGPAGGRTLFRSDFEDESFDGWYVQSIDERATIVGGGAAESDYAARFEVRDEDEEPDTGDERSEIRLPSPRFAEGEEIYFRDAIRVPDGGSIDRTYQIIHQLHEEDWDGSPGVAVFLERCPSLTIGAGDGSIAFLADAPIEYDRWHDLVYRVKLSRDPTVGFMEVWLDGAQQRLVNGETRMYGRTIQADRTYLKAGIYRGGSHSGTSIVEHDDIAVGTSMGAVLDR